MPVRSRVEEMLSNEFIGGVTFLFGEPKNVTQEDYDAVMEWAAHLYARVIQRIDWPRVLIEASAICIERDHEDEPEGRYDDARQAFGVRKRPCWRCLEVALLSYEHAVADDLTRARNAPGARWPPRGWTMPRELRLMMIAWIRARRKSVRDAESA